MRPEDFKIGDYVIILRYPPTWSSVANKNCHFRVLDTFPYHCQIKNIVHSHTDPSLIPNYYSMTEGKFGWSLSDLVADENIILDKRKTRLEKLKRLNESNL